MISTDEKIGPRVSGNGQDGDATPRHENIRDAPPGAPARRKPFIIAAVLVVATLVGWAVYHRSYSNTALSSGAAPARVQTVPVPVVTVTVATARKGDIGVFVNGLGAVTPLNTVAVNSRVAGQIMKVNYQEGQLVHAGDSLVEIDPGPNQAALIQAEGQLDRDTALLEEARLDLNRYQEAFAKNAIPKQQFDTQVALVHQDEGTVKLDQGLLDNAKVQLAYCHITAPISGRVGLRLVDAGNIVQANGSNLLVITELQPITVIFNAAEDDLPPIQKQLRQGKHLTVDAFDRAQIKNIAMGILQTLDNQIDPTTGTVRFKAIFTNDDEALFPNQFVNARLLVDTLHDVTLLPNTAIQRNADSAFVYLLKPDQTVAMQTITVGTTDGNVSAVQGIKPGAVVAADNFNKLADGAKVTVLSPTNETNQAGSQKTTRKKNPQ